MEPRFFSKTLCVCHGDPPPPLPSVMFPVAERSQRPHCRQEGHGVHEGPRHPGEGGAPENHSGAKETGTWLGSVVSTSSFVDLCLSTPPPSSHGPHSRCNPEKGWCRRSSLQDTSRPGEKKQGVVISSLCKLHCDGGL